LLNRHPKRQRQEEKPAQGDATLILKVEGVPATSNKDRFKAICRALGEMQAGMRLAREPGAGSGEQGKRERGAGIVVRNLEIDKFHQK
jgi:hypothetical protein